MFEERQKQSMGTRVLVCAYYPDLTARQGLTGRKSRHSRPSSGSHMTQKGCRANKTPKAFSARRRVTPQQQVKVTEGTQAKGPRGRSGKSRELQSSLRTEDRQAERGRTQVVLTDW